MDRQTLDIVFSKIDELVNGIREDHRGEISDQQIHILNVLTHDLDEMERNFVEEMAKFYECKD